MDRAPISPWNWMASVITVQSYLHRGLSLSCLTNPKLYLHSPALSQGIFHQFTCRLWRSPFHNSLLHSTIPRTSSYFRSLEYWALLPQLRKSTALFDSTRYSKKVSPGRRVWLILWLPFSQGSQSLAWYPVPEKNCLITLIFRVGMLFDTSYSVMVKSRSQHPFSTNDQCYYLSLSTDVKKLGTRHL